MSLNHHILAKATTDSVLLKFKSNEWNYAGGKGNDFYRVGTSATFPSPDAAFYDPTNKVVASFEFKPPTETKRGILTGLGQSIAYLQNCDISFLIAPKKLEDFNLGIYLNDLYDKQIKGKIPTGLILYNNDNPSNVELVQSVDDFKESTEKHKKPEVDRFWAKHQDLPLPLFHLILHYYYLKRIHLISSDPFAELFVKEFISETVLDDFSSKDCVLDLSGQAIKTVAGTKNIVFLQKTLNEAKRNPNVDKAKAKIANAIDTDYVGDNYYNSIRKNYISFLKHLQVIDSENNLTDKGFTLYHIGLVNGPTSKVFTDYFTKEVLTTGHHLDLILDIDSIKQNHPKWNISKVLCEMENDYENKGYIRRNPNRKQSEESNVRFLKYERILWKALDLVDKNGYIQWKKITEICSLPELN